MTPLDDKDHTVAMSPDELPGGTAAVSASSDPDATVAAAPSTAALDPSPAPAAPDGIDALDDPYFSPATAPEELTSARMPVMSIPSPVESLPERRARFPRWGIALIVIALLAVAGIAACLTYEQELWGGKTVPNVIGQTEQEATDVLSRLGFSVDVSYRPGDADFGEVLDCDPAPGVRADPVGGARLVVAGERAIPEVVGLTAEEATAALHEAGAQNVTLTQQNSEQPAGTVLAVDPAEGSPFVSSDPVTLTIARAYTVPDVRGMSLPDARAAIEAEGLVASVTYVDSDGEKSFITDVSPAPDTEVAAGSTVTLSVVSPYPSSPQSLVEYFECTPQELGTYLTEQGFSLTYGGTHAATGNARAVYQGQDGSVVQISDDPELGDVSGTSAVDALARGAGVGGVRIAFSEGALPSGAASETEAGVRAVMGACGLTGLRETCTQDNVTLPEGVMVGEGDHFICGTGEQGAYTWAVIIGGREGATRVVALVAPTEHFSAIDLSPYGGSVCDYVAVSDLYAR